MKAEKRLILLVPFVLLALSPGACGGRTTLTSPVVRVDLRAQLPGRLQQLVVDGDDSFPCNMEVTLADQGVVQKFAINWHVLQDGPDRYVTALSVEPAGPTSGAVNPKASGAVGNLKQETAGKSRIIVLPLTLTWEATKGCGQVKASKKFLLRADDASCKKPEAPKGLLKPVE